MSAPHPDFTALHANLSAELDKRPLTRGLAGELILRARAREDCGAADELRKKFPNNSDIAKVADTLEHRASHWRQAAEKWVELMGKKE